MRKRPSPCPTAGHHPHGKQRRSEGLPDFTFGESTSHRGCRHLQFWRTLGSSHSDLIQYGKCLLGTWRYFFFFCYIIDVLYCCQITHTISKCQSTLKKSKDSAMWKWAPSSIIICSGLLALRFLSASREAVFVLLFYPTWHLHCNSLFLSFQEVSQEEGWRN